MVCTSPCMSGFIQFNKKIIIIMSIVIYYKYLYCPYLVLDTISVTLEAFIYRLMNYKIIFNALLMPCNAPY